MLTDYLIDAIINKKPAVKEPVRDISDAKIGTPGTIKKVNSRSIDYSHRHRGQWFPPEYNLKEIQLAQDTESYLFRAIQKKVNRITVAGFTFTGRNEEPVKYIKRRLDEISWATQIPFAQNVETTFHDLFRYSNCMWVKVRNEEKSTGDSRMSLTGGTLPPVAGYFILPFEALKFKTKKNGDIIKVMEEIKGGEKVEYSVQDVVHFYANKKPGFTIGTPEMFPALDDIALLRRIEENVEDLIETNLFPVYHYQVGTVEMPERVGPDGEKETDIVKKKIEYMPAGGVYVSDFRHKITAIGSEGRALRIDAYITHFKNRMLSAIGTNALDMGEGDSANRSTAGTLAKGTLMDIEAMSVIVKRFIEFYIINELLIEGGFDPFDDEEKVEIRFGTIDKEEKRADENQEIQAFTANIRTLDEVRQNLGERPWTDELFERTFFRLYKEPESLLARATPGSAASQALGEHGNSSVSSAAVKAEKANAEKAAKAKQVSARSGSQNLLKNKVAPQNQHGARSSAKTTRDVILDEANEIVLTCDEDITDDRVNKWFKYVVDSYNDLNDGSVNFKYFVESLKWRL